jgi:UDP-glucose 4-epimerase
MNILVTGGAGFIGSHLIDALLDAGHYVQSVDDLSLGRVENICHLNDHPRFRFHRLDVLEREALSRVFQQGAFQCVFHMVANSDIQAGARQTDLDLKRTFLTTISVLECMKEFGVKKLVFASTSAVYGEKDEVLHEDIGPLFPISFYGASKLASEAFISAFGANFGIKSWIFRFPNVVGERTTHGVLYDFISALEKDPRRLTVLGDGTQCKPYLYVKDLVEGMLCGWERSGEGLNYFNLGVETSTTVSQIAQFVVDAMGLKRVELNYTGGDRGWVGDVPRFQYDLSKIHRLGWKARRTSDEAVQLAIQAELERRRVRP